MIGLDSNVIACMQDCSDDQAMRLVERLSLIASDNLSMTNSYNLARKTSSVLQEAREILSLGNGNVEYVKRLLEPVEDCPEAHYLKAICCFRVGFDRNSAQEGIKELSAALTEDPTNPVYQALVSVLHKSKIEKDLCRELDESQQRSQDALRSLGRI